VKTREAIGDWQDQLSVVIVAYNEENGIQPTLEGLRERLPRAEVIVVDDGSRDQTLTRALAVPGVRVVSHAYNRGYGAALKTGMRLASRRHVAWFDADNEHRVDDLVAMAKRISEDNHAAVIGRRIGPSVSAVRSTGKLAIRMLARSLGVDLGKDLNCGLRVFKHAVIRRYLAILPDAFSASMTSTMVLIEQGYRVAFHDIDVNRRIGSSKVKIRDGFATMVLVLRFVMLFAPLRIFFLPGLVAFLAGVTYGAVRAVLEGRGVPVAGMMVALAGMLACMLGLVADQISQLRLSQLASGLRAEEFADAQELTEASALAQSDRSAASPARVTALPEPSAPLRHERDAPSEALDDGNASEQLVDPQEGGRQRVER